MKIKKPNIHIFVEHKKYYLYDVNINAVVTIPYELYEFFSLWGKEDEKEITADIEEDISFLMEQGFLTEKKKISSIKHYETDTLKDLYMYNMGNVILQVTQNCNLRCEYCVYSGSYINRVHTNKRMSFETAVKTIDFLAAHSLNCNEVSIGFYGGEPLLEIELIKKAVSYAKEVFGEKKINFNMTTNATLLNMDIADFLVQNDFNITISLDGPRNIHNKNRIFANSNKGTFDLIMENIALIREKYLFFDKKISFNAVIDLKQNVSCTNEFFLNYDTVKGLNVNGTFINPVNRKEILDFDPELNAISNYEVFKVFLYACDSDLFSEYKPTLYESEIASIKQAMCERYIGVEGYEDIISPGGQCLPGIQRFFVTADGKFFPCERVDETSEELCIGDLQQGINIDNAIKILNVADVTSRQCIECWCYKMCYQCISKAQEDGRINAEARLKWCQQTRAGVEGTIKDYIILKKYGCKFEEA